MTEVDFDQITSYQRYKLMASLIVPRPIALVTTLGANGVANAAPFSMFNMVGEDPPILMVSINRLSDGRLKDTAANILHSGEFVVHMSDEPLAAKMHACGESFPSDVSELAAVGLPCHARLPATAPAGAPCPAKAPSAWLRLAHCCQAVLGKAVPSYQASANRLSWFSAVQMPPTNTWWPLPLVCWPHGLTGNNAPLDAPAADDHASPSLR